MTTPATDTTTHDTLTCPRCGSDDLTLDHAAHYTCGSCGGYTTTHDAALAVIERHLSEWETYGVIGNVRRTVVVAALTQLRDELRDTPTHDTWNADTSPFDPVRAGMTEEGDGLGGIRWSMRFGQEAIFTLWRYPIHWYFAITQAEDDPRRISIPADLPHNVVLSILRANGWGGDDESV